MTTNLIPAQVFPPGDFIREELEAREWTQGDLAEILGRPVQMVNEIITGKKAITPETAKELAAAFGTSAEYFLNLENAYRLKLAKTDPKPVSERAQLYSRVPVREIVKRNWIPGSKDLGTLGQQICSFLGICDLGADPEWRFAFRRSDVSEKVSYSHLAWLARCRQLAREQEVKVSQIDVSAIRDFAATLTRVHVDNTTLPTLTNELAGVGVRTVFLEQIKGTKIDGAAFWMDEGPVVAISLRYDRIDSFWFTLLHELAHIVLHNNRSVLDVDIVRNDSDEEDDPKPPIEREADNQAHIWSVPQQQLNQFIAETQPYYSHAKITSFAREIGVHPGLVVGQLQHRAEIPWTHSRKFLVKVRHLLPLTS